MKIFSFFFILFAILAVFSSCEDVIQLDLPDGEYRLTVDGNVSDTGDTVQVILSSNAPYFDDGATPRVGNALVVVRDDTGRADTLREEKPGVYLATFRGEIGRSYSLFVRLADGKVYETAPQLLQAVAKIDTIYSEYFQRPFDEGEDSSFQVAIEFQDPSGTEDFYRWKYWANDEINPQNLLFTSDQFFDGEYIKNFTVVRESQEKGTKIRIVQMSTSRDYYDYLRKLRDQVQRNDGLFSAPPAPVPGNLINTANSKDYALGFFGVSSLTETGIEL